MDGIGQAPRRHGLRQTPRANTEDPSMSDHDRNVAAFPGAARPVAVDAGLRAHMIRVYNYMAGGVALTCVLAYIPFQAAGGDALRDAGNVISGLTPFGQVLMTGCAPLVLILAALGLVF